MKRILACCILVACTTGPDTDRTPGRVDASYSSIDGKLDVKIHRGSVTAIYNRDPDIYTLSGTIGDPDSTTSIDTVAEVFVGRRTRYTFPCSIKSLSKETDGSRIELNVLDAKTLFRLNCDSASATCESFFVHYIAILLSKPPGSPAKDTVIEYYFNTTNISKQD